MMRITGNATMARGPAPTPTPVVPPGKPPVPPVPAEAPVAPSSKVKKLRLIPPKKVAALAPQPEDEPDLPPLDDTSPIVRQPGRLILLHVGRRMGVSLTEMKGQQRAWRITRPRQIAMWIMKRITLMSLTEIGRVAGNRDHTTVMHAAKMVESLIDCDPELKAWVKLLEEECRQLLEIAPIIERSLASIEDYTVQLVGRAIEVNPLECHATILDALEAMVRRHEAAARAAGPHDPEEGSAP